MRDHSSDPPGPAKGVSSRWLFWCSLLATSLAVAICFRIEYLNAINGSVLPRRDVTSRGNPKWRLAAQRTARLDALLRIRNDRLNRWAIQNPSQELPTDEQIMQEPLTEAERALLGEALAKNARMASLYGAVRSFGLMQYVVAPLAVILSLASIRTVKSWCVRILLMALAIVAAACVVMMLYRGYFTSLGLYG